MQKEKRIIFLDLLRTVAIALIIAVHIFQTFHHPFGDFFGIENFLWITLGGVGVTIFLIISGFVLQMKYENRNSESSYFSFILDRILSIYPVYYSCLVVGIAVYIVSNIGHGRINFFAPNIFSNLKFIFLNLTGFFAFSGAWSGPFLDTSWFIGLIITLYFLFPLISKVMRKNPHVSILVALFISILSRYLIGKYNILYNRALDWFPLCRIYEFSLGIYLFINLKKYIDSLKNSNDGLTLKNICSKLLLFTSKISFPLFLIHYQFLIVLRQLASIMSLSLAIILYLVLVVALSWLIIKATEKFPKKLIIQTVTKSKKYNLSVALKILISIIIFISLIFASNSINKHFMSTIFSNSKSNTNLLNLNSKINEDYVKLIPLDKMFSGSYINVNIARESAILTNGEYQYISYFDINQNLIVARRKNDSKVFEKNIVPIDREKNKPRGFSLSDPHNYISMQMDEEGYMHLSYGNHNSLARYARSHKPYNNSIWLISKNGFNLTNKNKNTYVSFVKLINGSLLAIMRDGNSGNGNTKMMAYNITSRRWYVLNNIFISGNRSSSQYLWRTIVSNDGSIHLAWTSRLLNIKYATELEKLKEAKFNEVDPQELFQFGFLNQDITYAKSTDNGKTWTNDAVILKIPIYSDFFNHYGSDYDSKNNPHFIFTESDENQIPQQWHLYWNGSIWVKNKVTEYKKRFNWTYSQTQGESSTYIARPTVLVAKDDTVLIFSRTKENGNVIELYISNKSDYETWAKVIIFNGSVGGWEPQVDYELWHKTEKIDILLLGITDDYVKEIWCKKLRICDVEYVKIDKYLKNSMGYILELDYKKIIKSQG